MVPQFLHRYGPPIGWSGWVRYILPYVSTVVGMVVLTFSPSCSKSEPVPNSGYLDKASKVSWSVPQGWVHSTTCLHICLPNVGKIAYKAIFAYLPIPICQLKCLRGGGEGVHEHELQVLNTPSSKGKTALQKPCNSIDRPLVCQCLSPPWTILVLIVDAWWWRWLVDSSPWSILGACLSASCHSCSTCCGSYSYLYQPSSWPDILGQPTVWPVAEFLSWNPSSWKPLALQSWGSHGLRQTTICHIFSISRMTARIILRRSV